MRQGKWSGSFSSIKPAEDASANAEAGKKHSAAAVPQNKALLAKIVLRAGMYGPFIPRHFSRQRVC
jgi:hypothetical protein